MNQETDASAPESTTPTPESPTPASTSAQQPFQPLQSSGAGAPKDYSEGWSWGGFMLEFVVILGSKQYMYLWLFILYFVPLVNLFAMIGVKIYFGLKGRKVVAESDAFANDDEKRGFLKGIDHAGKIVFFISLAFIALWIILFATVFSASMNKLEDRGAGFERMMEERAERFEDRLGDDPTEAEIEAELEAMFDDMEAMMQ